ncbi:MAG TPA: leucine--tRNA ligase [Chlamydiales bacterium]|nr:leucine--tRNA ligase [Chlamydiales bacterium]
MQPKYEQLKYDHSSIEKKWQDTWDKKGTFVTKYDPSKPKYYVLDMFPYPSGSGLHVGHLVGYTATDIIARYKRMKGFNVLHPMGWDSFGLPAEQYAIRTGTHPRVTTKANIDNFRKQLKSVGFSYDWSREIATSEPDYYKWTQWIFTKLYEKGLAYEAEIPVNYCPHLGTVLANEEVDNGHSKEGGYPVVKMPLKQWIFKITEYADRLIQDLDLVDWPENIKALQTNWIGKSQGALVHFDIENTKEKITVFTTCHDTLFGCSFIVVAPEHPFVDQLTTGEHKEAVNIYKKLAERETEIERTEITKEKTGVFTGSFAVNPATGKKIPIWVADYVLAGYGTGAVMGVPSHCERDFEFAEKFHLPKMDVIVVPENAPKKAKEGKEAWEGGGIVKNSSNSQLTLDGLHSDQAKEVMADFLEKTGHGARKVQYKLRDWLFSRQRYWGEPFPILHFEDGTKRALDVDELPLTPPEISDFKPSGDGKSPLAKVKEWVNVIDSKTGKKAQRETNTMPQWAGSCWYYLRFCDPHNDKAAWDPKLEKYWMSVDLYVGGIEHAVLHLLYARFWHKVLYDCGLVSTLEPFQTLRNQGLVVARSFKNSSNLYISPDEVEEKNGKYFHKKTGQELQSQIDKMSKSKLNGITPDDIISEYGADALRLFEMFMGPLEKEKVWNSEAVGGCRRFLTRIFDMVHSEKVTSEETDDGKRCIHKLIHKMSQDMELLSFNTAIAKMMEFVNDFSALNKYPKSALVDFVKLLSPFAPHIAEELWEHLGQKEALITVAFPKADPAYIEDAVVTYVIQVNGKVRARIDLPKDRPEEELVQTAKAHDNVCRFLDGKKILKSIFVPNKLVNFVVADE